MGQGYHRLSQQRLQQVTHRETGRCIPVVTSAGALVEALDVLGARRIAMIVPYVPLTCMVADYIEAERATVVDRIALEIPDNLEVGRRDPLALCDIYKDLCLTGRCRSSSRNAGCRSSPPRLRRRIRC